MELRSQSAQLQSKLVKKSKYNSETIIGRGPTPGRVALRTSQHSSDLCQIGSASSGGSGVRVRGTEAGPGSVGSSIATSDRPILRPASRARAAAAQAVASAAITGYDQPMDWKIQKGARILIYAPSLTPISGRTGESRAVPRTLRAPIGGLEPLNPVSKAPTDDIGLGVGPMPLQSVLSYARPSGVGAGDRGRSLPARPGPAGGLP